MKFTVDDLMRNAFVMCRDDNEYFNFCRRLWYAGFDQMPLKYRGKYPKVIFGSGKYICALNHFVLVNMAKTLNLDHITVFESDAYPMNECRKQLSILLDKDGVPDDADEITLGNINFIRDYTNRGKEKCLVDVDVKKRFGHIKDDLWGTQAVVYFRNGYDTWLDNYIKQEQEIGPDFFKWLTPNCYSTTRSYFLQVGMDNVLQYPDHLRDKEWLDDFPEIETL